MKTEINWLCGIDSINKNKYGQTHDRKNGLYGNKQKKLLGFYRMEEIVLQCVIQCFWVCIVIKKQPMYSNLPLLPSPLHFFCNMSAEFLIQMQEQGFNFHNDKC